MASILIPEVLLSLLVGHKRTGLLLLSRSRRHLTRSRPLDAYKVTRKDSPQEQACTPFYLVISSPLGGHHKPDQQHHTEQHLEAAAAAAVERHYMVLTQQTSVWHATTGEGFTSGLCTAKPQPHHTQHCTWMSAACTAMCLAKDNKSKPNLWRLHCS